MELSGRSAFTLVEVAFSLVILATVVTFTIVILGGALRDQQINRYRILAAAKAATLLERLCQPQEDYHNAPNGSENNVWCNNYSTVPMQIAVLGIRYQNEMPAMMTAGRYDLERVVGSSIGGCYPVPTPIARRIDSNQDEIQGIYDRGGKLYYFDPSEMAGSSMIASTAQGTNRNAATDDLQRLVFSVIGPPQQNLLPGHPWMAPSVKLYPYPPSNQEWTTDLSILKYPGTLRWWDKPTGSQARINQTGGNAEGYGIYGNLMALAPNALGYSEVYYEKTVNLGHPATIRRERTDTSNWEWQAFLGVSAMTDIATRDKILRGEWDNPQAAPLSLPGNPTAWSSSSAWSPWLAALPEYRRLVHWHWNRIRVQMEKVHYSPDVPPTPPPPPGSGGWVPETVVEYVNPWPTETVTWTDDNGGVHRNTRQIYPRPTWNRPTGKMIWVPDPGSDVKRDYSDGKYIFGLPAPPNGLGKAVGLRGTDILYEDHESFPGNRLEQIRLGMPSLERRVMYRTAALALWAKVRMGKSIHKAEARLLGTAADVGDVLAADPNVAEDLALAQSVLPYDADPEKNQNPLLGFVAPPENAADIHPAQVLALNYVAHAAMLVTGYRPPFIDNQNSTNPDRLINLHASLGNPNLSVRNRYYRKFGQETFYLAHPMYCEKPADFDAAVIGKDTCAANINTQPWVEKTIPPPLSSEESEFYSKQFIWSMLTDNYNRILDLVTERTLPLVPGKPPVLIYAPYADRLCRKTGSNAIALPVSGADRDALIKVRRFYEGGSRYRDWRGRGRPNAVMDGASVRWEKYDNNTANPTVPSVPGEMDDPLICSGTDQGGVWKPSRWGPEGFSQDLDTDGLNDDAVVNPFPPPFAQEGAFDCWGRRKFRWRVIAPVGQFDDPQKTDFTNWRSFLLKGGLEDIAYNDSAHWEADQGKPAWSDEKDVLCGPIEAEYVPAPNVPADCDDLAMAKNAMRTCMAWVMKYTNRYPADYIVPKPANCQTAWHRPLFYFDLFLAADAEGISNARRPANPVDWSHYHPVGWTGEAAFPALFFQNSKISTVDGLHGLYNLFMATPAIGGPKGNRGYAANAVRDAAGNRSPAPFARVNEVDASAWISAHKDKPYKDILRVGPPILDGVTKVPHGLLEAHQAALMLSYLHGDPLGIPTPDWSTTPGASPLGFNTPWFAPNLGSGSGKAPSDTAIQKKLFTVTNPPRLHYPLGSPANTDPIPVQKSHAWHFQPFTIADRCRQLVFWTVDWKSYEDSETVPSDPIDWSMAPLRFSGAFTVPTPKSPLRGNHNPERMLCWLNQARDRTVASPRMDDRSRAFFGANVWRLDDRPEAGLQGMPIAKLTGNLMGAGGPTVAPGGHEPDNSGDSAGIWFYANMGRFGADRDGNGVLSRGLVPASQRMRAREVGRFLYYDPVMPLSTRR